MQRTAVINVVGLSRSLIGLATPCIQEYVRQGVLREITPAFPAVTCTAQSNYLTGCSPREHGIVGNGWYDRSLAEVQFWKQSNHLVARTKLWDELRGLNPAFTCANLFWWYNMYSTADFSITPRPAYPADGRKVFDIYSWPYSIRTEIKAELGEFPFPAFWGPAAGTSAGQFAPDTASRWIAESAKWVERKHQPTLSLVYLPHLDYNLQRLGPNQPGIDQDLRQIDRIVGDLLAFYQSRSVQIILLSEYGLSPVDTPVHINRLFREQGWLSIKEELGLELLDCGASKAFAISDHQVAHVYINDRSLGTSVRKLLESTPGIERVLGEAEKPAMGIDHARAGDLIAISESNAWFTYYYWQNDQRAPDFARTVDIHRKPGYDPVELFLDPAQHWIKLKIASKLLRKRLGLRMLMDIIPLRADLVKGSHGGVTSGADGPVIILPPRDLPDRAIESTAVYGILRDAVLGK